ALDVLREELPLVERVLLDQLPRPAGGVLDVGAGDELRPGMAGGAVHHARSMSQNLRWTRVSTPSPSTWMTACSKPMEMRRPTYSPSEPSLGLTRTRSPGTGRRPADSMRSPRRAMPCAPPSAGGVTS